MNTNTDTNTEKMVKLHTVTIQEFADNLGIEYLQASALMAFLVNTNIATEAGKAAKAPGARGKAATLYDVPAEAVVVFFNDEEPTVPTVPTVPAVPALPEKSVEKTVTEIVVPAVPVVNVEVPTVPVTSTTSTESVPEATPANDVPVQPANEVPESPSVLAPA